MDFTKTTVFLASIRNKHDQNQMSALTLRLEGVIKKTSTIHVSCNRVLFLAYNFHCQFFTSPKWVGGGGGSNYINVHGHQVFAKMYMYKMYKNVQNMFFPVWKFPG